MRIAAGGGVREAGGVAARGRKQHAAPAAATTDGVA